jgi:hypothetical protein
MEEILIYLQFKVTLSRDTAESVQRLISGLIAYFGRADGGLLISVNLLLRGFCNQQYTALEIVRLKAHYFTS